MTATRFLIGMTLASLLSCSIQHCRAAEWDSIDKALFTGQIVLQAVDIAQTNYIRQHPDQFKEANPLYGNPPNMGRVIIFKAALVGGIYWLVKDMPSADRKLVLGVVDVIQLGIVGRNVSLGVGVSF